MRQVFDIIKQPKGSNPQKPELKEKEGFFADTNRIKPENRPREVVEPTDNYHSLIFYVSVAALVVALAGVGAIWWLLKTTPSDVQKEVVSSNQPEKKKTPETETTISQQSLSNTPTPSVATTEKKSAQPEIDPSRLGLAETDKSTLKIRVVNGTGVTGEAAETKKLLEEGGFKIDSIGNASRRYAQTTIYHKKDKAREANLVKEALTTKRGVLQESEAVAGVYDVVVAIGKT